ncbi:hypothetical protein HZF02_26745 [Pseudomonas yamanorum]|nr:hypothetical protein HZF02_26745 [Pseudomonas yamanorum]
MTTNQTIDGVPRDLLERIMHGCMFSLSRQQHEELRALLDAPVVSAPLSVPDECPHLIVFDDTDREQLMFAGAGARASALKTWENISRSWNAHLFVRVERNSSDDQYPSAGHTRAAQPQGEPVYQVQHSGSYAGWRNVDAGTYAELKDDKRYMSRIVYAEQPAPVAVVLPERKRADHCDESQDVKSYFEELGWNAYDDELKRLNPSL